MSTMLATTALAVLGATTAPAAVAANRPPTAVLQASPTSGSAPVTAQLDARGSSDPDAGDVLTYAWDFDADGITDATGPTATRTFATMGLYTVALRVKDSGGLTDTATVDIWAGNTPPAEPDITWADEDDRWRVGEPVSLTAHSHDLEQGPIPPAGFDWTVSVRTCAADDPAACSTREIERFRATDRISFIPGNHAYPATLLIAVVARDEGGLWTDVTRRLDPQTVEVSVDSDPSGAELVVGPARAQGPVTLTAIAGSRIAVTAPSSITRDGVPLSFVEWSDGGALSHVLSVPASPTATVTARFANRAPRARIDVDPRGLGAHLDASSSNDPDAEDRLEFTWDLDSDGSFDDASGPRARVGDLGVRPRVRVVDLAGNRSIAEAASGRAVAVPVAVAAPRIAPKACRGGSFLARYFANPDLRGLPVLVRCEQRVGSNWQRRAPTDDLPKDGFSAQWTGALRSAGGRYRLRVDADDAVRVWVDGRLVVNRWSTRSRSQQESVVVPLAAGSRTIRVVFADRSGPARLAVSWQRLS